MIDFEADQYVRLNSYLLAKLRRVQRIWINEDGPEGLTKVATLGFIGLARVLYTELSKCWEQQIASALLLRTMWHNAGQLSWLLHGPGDVLDRLQSYEHDFMTRSHRALVERPRSILGHNRALEMHRAADNDTAAKLIEDRAVEAKTNLSVNEPLWSKVPVKVLWKSMRRTFRIANSKIDYNLDVFLKQSAISLEEGDDFAHPNPHIALNILRLVDIENLKLVIHDETRTQSEEHKKRIFRQSLTLLMIHCIAIYAYNDKFPIVKILKTLNTKTSNLLDANPASMDTNT